MIRMPLIDINYYQASKTLSPYPLNVMLETSAICNIKCPMCPRQYKSRKNRKDGLMVWMPKGNPINKKDTFHLIMEQLRKTHIITMHYSGEPTLNQKLFQMCGEVKWEYEIPFIKMNTNGLALDKDDCEAIVECGLNLVTFSLECNEKVQKKHRIGADYNKVKNNIIKVNNHLQLLRSQNRSQTIIDIQHLKGDNTTDEELKASAIEWAKIGVPVKIASICSIGNQVEDMGSVRTEKKNCREIWTNLIVNWQGDVTPCCVDHSFQLKFGNIIKEPLEKVWVNEKISSLRELHTHFNKYGEKKRLPKLCQQCLGSK